MIGQRAAARLPLPFPVDWWTRPDSNRRFPACKAGVFPLDHGPKRERAVPTRGFEPPHPVGQQILSLSRLPIPPRRRRSQADGIIPPILSARSPQTQEATARRHLSRPGARGGSSWLAGHDPASPSPLRRDQAPGFRPGPSPLALLPAAHSPSRAGCPGPLVGPCPTGSPLTRAPRTRAGMLSVAVVVRPAFANLPPLAVSWGGLAPEGAGSREVPLAGTRQASDGSPIYRGEYSMGGRGCQGDGKGRRRGTMDDGGHRMMARPRYAGNR